MTDEELAAQLLKLQELQRRLHDGTHELLNILAVLKGEVDLAVERARMALNDFYVRYPDFLGGP